MSLQEKIQDFLEADLKRPITSAELRVLRKFVTDFQNAKDEKPKEKAQGEIVSEPWRPKAGGAPTAADAEIKPIVKADSRLFSRVDAWAKMGTTESSPKSKAASDLPVEVGIKDRLGGWKEKEAGGGNGKEVGTTSPRPADLPTEGQGGVKDRLGVWKAKEEGKTEVKPRSGSFSGRAQADLDGVQVVGVKDRLGKWKEAEEGKANASPQRKEPVKLVVETEEGPPPAAAPLRQRLASYQQTVEEKEKSGAKAKDAHEEIAEAQGLAARKDRWAQVSEQTSISKTVDVTKEEHVQAAPKLKDRLKTLEAATAEKPIEKAPVAVPYDDDYKPPAAPGEDAGAAAPVSARKEPVHVESVGSLKDRMADYAKAAEDKPVPKIEVNLDEEPQSQ